MGIENHDRPTDVVREEVIDQLICPTTMLVNFLVAGVIKGGSTALCRALAEHDEICMPSQRFELHFFNRGAFRWSRRSTYEEYHAHFAPDERTKIIGEGTPHYLHWKGAPGRILEYNPKMKMVFILRNPIDRAYSHYLMERRRGSESLSSFSAAIRLEKLRGLAEFPRQPRRHQYVAHGFYSQQIRRYLEHFPREQILALQTEELRNRHKATMDRLCDFLGVPPLEQEVPPVSFRTQHEPMAEADRRYLSRKYQKDISDLEELLDWDLTNWLSAR